MKEFYLWAFLLCKYSKLCVKEHEQELKIQFLMLKSDIKQLKSFLWIYIENNFPVPHEGIVLR